MTLTEWINDTTKVFGLEGLEFQNGRPEIFCQDGFRLTVQTEGGTVYSTYEDTYKGREYKTLDVSEISAEEKLLKPYEHLFKDGDYEELVYAYVPFEVVECIIEKHGGFSKKVINLEQYRNKRF